MITKNVWQGIQVFCDSYLQANARDYVLILYTRDCRESAAAISTVCTDRGVSCSEFPMNPSIDISIGERLKSALENIDRTRLSGRFIIVTLELHTLSHSRTLRDSLNSAGISNVSFYRLMSASLELFANALHSPPIELLRRNSWLLNFLKNANSARIQTPSGTDIQVSLDGEKYKWISSRGIAASGRDIILPAGEVATYPANIDGRFVADFALHTNEIIDFDVRLATSPITIHLRNGQVFDFECSRHEIREYLDSIFSSPYGNRVGELGIGTNPSISDATFFNSHINERRVGIHLGFGQHNQGPRVPYKCKTHVDLISKDGVITLGDGSRVSLKDFPSDSFSHPSDAQDEDVFSPDDFACTTEDCCGTLID